MFCKAGTFFVFPCAAYFLLIHSIFRLGFRLTYTSDRFSHLYKMPRFTQAFFLKCQLNSMLRPYFPLKGRCRMAFPMMSTDGAV